MERRRDIIMAVEIGQANGVTKCEAAGCLLKRVRKRRRVRPKKLGEEEECLKLMKCIG